MFKLDNFGVILFVSFSYKNGYNVHFMKIEKIDAKIDFSVKNSKSLCITCIIEIDWRKSRVSKKFDFKSLEHLIFTHDMLKDQSIS